jgi:hypothetical protein
MQRARRKNLIATYVASLVLGAAAVSPAFAADAHGHDHGALPKLTLNKGKQWSTDAPLREGMTKIRGIVEPQLKQVHAGKMDAAGYARTAADIEAQVGYIVGNCKLDPDADAVLHLIIAEVGEGIDAMRAKDGGARAEQGMVKVVAALNSYGKYFDHPGWKSIRTGH